jgi:hypothetical protein
MDIIVGPVASVVETQWEKDFADLFNTVDLSQANKHSVVVLAQLGTEFNGN